MLPYNIPPSPPDTIEFVVATCIILNTNQLVKIIIITSIKSKCFLNNKIPSIVELAGSCSLNCQKSGASQKKKNIHNNVSFWKIRKGIE